MSDFRYHYKILRLDLNGGLNLRHFAFEGAVLVYHTGATPIQVRLNAPQNDSITLHPKNRIVAPFSHLYISSVDIPEQIELFLANPKEVLLEGGEIRLVSDYDYWETINSNCFYSTASVVSVALRFQSIYMCNPIGSNVYAVVEEIWHDNGTQLVIGVNTETDCVNPGGNRIGKLSETFIWGPARCNIRIRNNALAAFYGSTLLPHCNARGFQTMKPDRKFVVTPGTSLGVEGSQQSFSAGFHWTEIPLSTG